MSILEDIGFYTTLLTDSDAETRNEAHIALRDIGESSLLGIPASFCRFRLPDNNLREVIIDEILDTLQTIDAPSVGQILDFIANSEKAGDFWADDVKAKSKSVLEILGDPPPPREKYPIAGIITQFFIALVGSENAEERAEAQTMLINLGTENLDYFMNALEHGKGLHDSMKQTHLYQFQHPRPQDLITTIQMMGTANARSALAWMAVPQAKWEVQIAELAKQAVELIVDVKPDAWESHYTEWYNKTAITDELISKAENSNCLVCGKSFSKDKGVGGQFCSSECYQKGKNNINYRM